MGDPRHRRRRLPAAAASLSLLALLLTRAPYRAEATPNLTLVTNGEPRAVVVSWSRSDSPVAAFAASQVRGYVEQISGARLRVLRGKVDAPSALGRLSSALVVVTGKDAERYLELPAGSSARIPSEWLLAAARQAEGLERDGLLIRTHGDEVVLAGRGDRGTLYAAYELLERLGVEFFAPNFAFYEGRHEHVPRRRSVVVAPLAVVEEPSLAYRRKDVGQGWSHTDANLKQLIAWMGKARLNVLAYPADFLGLGLAKWSRWRKHLIPVLEQRGMLIEVGGHGYNSFLPRDEYQDEHPRWFVKGANVFDVTNGNAREQYIRNVVNYLRKRPEIDVFDAWPPDVAKWPKRVIKRFGRASNAEAYLTGRLSRALRAKVPWVRVEQVAYRPATKPPSPKYMYGPNAFIDVAPYDRSYAEPIFGPRYERNEYYRELIERWRARFDGELGVHEYYRKYRWRSLPVVMPNLIGQEIPYYRSLGTSGLRTYSEPADWLTYELTHLLVAAMSWNHALDPQAFVGTYLRQRYGAAARETGRYFSLVESAARELFDRKAGNYGSEAGVSDALDHYIRAREAVEAARATVAPESTPAFLLKRLERNAHYAVADTSITYYDDRNEPEKVGRAKKRMRELVEKHRFDGIVLQNLHSMRRFKKGVDRSNTAFVYEMYRRVW